MTAEDRAEFEHNRRCETAPAPAGVWRVAPGDARCVFFSGVAKPINAGTAERARLIAAAPDMLAALQEASEAFERIALCLRPDSPIRAEAEKHANAAHAAIRKATQA